MMSLGPTSSALDETAGQGRGHLARAEKADVEFGCHENFVTGRQMERKRKHAANSRLEFARMTIYAGSGHEKCSLFYNAKQPPHMGFV